MASGLWRVLCALLISSLAQAAEPQELPPELPPVEIPLPEEAAAEPESPTRRDPSSLHTTVPVDEHRGEAKDTAELIATAPGTVLSDSGGHGQSKTVSIRGASANGVLVLLDGTPISTQGGGADLSRIPLAIVERFEVMRGGGSRHGPGALGGVVNVVTRAPSERMAASAELQVGSFQTQALQLSGTARLMGGQALLVVHGSKSEGDFSYLFDDRPAFDGNRAVRAVRQNNDSLQGGALARYRTAASAWTLDAVAELFAERRGLAGTAANPTPDARGSGQRASATFRASRPLGERWLLSTRTHALFERTELEGGLFGPRSDQLLSSFGAEATAEAFAGVHAVTLLGAVGGEALRPRLGADGASWAKASAMAQDELQLRDGDLVLSPSLRLDQTGPFTTLSPKLGALLRLPEGFELRGNAGQASRAPSFLELYVQQGRMLPNPSLRPERALFGDAQLAHQTQASRLAVGGFYALYEDLIAYELYPPFLIKPFNFRTAEVYGLEADGGARPHRWLSLQAGYTLLFSKNLRDDARYYLKELPYRPRHKGYGRLSFGPEVLRGRVEVAAQSAQHLNRTESLSLPARAFLNFGASSVLLRAPEVRVSAELKNVLDVQAADLDGYPLPGRAAYLTVSVALDSSAERGEP